MAVGHRTMRSDGKDGAPASAPQTARAGASDAEDATASQEASRANRVLVSVEDGMEEPRWLSRVEPFLQRVLTALGIADEELSVLFCTDEFMRTLNRQYRQVDAPTDVLSFEDGGEYEGEDGERLRSAGDIIISLETLPRNAARFGVSTDEELRRLLIHGALHLNGYDHGEAHLEPGVAPDDDMLRVQEALLRDLPCAIQGTV